MVRTKEHRAAAWRRRRRRREHDDSDLTAQLAHRIVKRGTLNDRHVRGRRRAEIADEADRAVAVGGARQSRVEHEALVHGDVAARQIAVEGGLICVIEACVEVRVTDLALDVALAVRLGLVGDVRAMKGVCCRKDAVQDAAALTLAVDRS